MTKDEFARDRALGGIRPLPYGFLRKAVMPIDASKQGNRL